MHTVLCEDCHWHPLLRQKGAHCCCAHVIGAGAHSGANVAARQTADSEAQEASVGAAEREAEQQELAGLRTMLKTASEDHDALQKQLLSNQRSSGTQLREAEDRLAAHQRIEAELQEKLDSVTADVEEQVPLLKEAESAISSQQDELDRAKAALDELELKHSDETLQLQEELVARIESENAGKLELETAKLDLAASKEEVSGLQQLVAALKSEGAEEKAVSAKRAQEAAVAAQETKAAKAAQEAAEAAAATASQSAAKALKAEQQVRMPL